MAVLSAEELSDWREPVTLHREIRFDQDAAERALASVARYLSELRELSAPHAEYDRGHNAGIDAVLELIRDRGWTVSSAIGSVPLSLIEELKR